MPEDSETMPLPGGIYTTACTRVPVVITPTAAPPTDLEASRRYGVVVANWSQSTPSSLTDQPAIPRA